MINLIVLNPQLSHTDIVTLDFNRLMVNSYGSLAYFQSDLRVVSLTIIYFVY